MSDQRSLTQILRARIESSGGFLPFEQFMQAALYEPGLGYYETKTVFGEQGDFVTASELGPWLTLALADLVHNGWQQLGEPASWRLIEQGSGSGRQIAALLDILQQLPMAFPSEVVSIEHCEQLRARQAALYAERGLSVRIVASPDELEAAEQTIYYSNELPDAFPVPLFHWQQGAFYERGVGLDGDTFCWLDREQPMASPPAIDPELVAAWPEDYISEYNPAMASWQLQIARIVPRGFVYTVDYGYSQQEYYRSQRVTGTLMAHLAQQASEDVLSDPGSRDITAHVDFSELARIGHELGLEPMLWMSQGGWLAQSPSVQALIRSVSAQTDATSLHLLAHAKRLLMPFGMGELFKLLVQSRGVAATRPDYLSQFDHLEQLRYE